MCLVSSESNRRIFETPTLIFLLQYLLKHLHLRGGGNQCQFGKSLVFDLFWTLPLVTLKRIHKVQKKYQKIKNLSKNQNNKKNAKKIQKI